MSLSNPPNISNERLVNSMLLSMKAGGALYPMIAHVGSFDAILLPSQEVLTKLGMNAVFEFQPSMTSDAAGASNGVPVHPAHWFMSCHLIRFDGSHGLGADFTTISGHRGVFGEALDTVVRGGLIGKRRVLGHLDPLPAQTQDAYRTFQPQTLNIFVIDDVMVEPEVVSECISKTVHARQHGSQQPQQASKRISSSVDPTSGSSNPSATAVAAVAQTPTSITSPSLARLLGTVASSLMGVGGSQATTASPSPAPPTTTSSQSSSSSINSTGHKRSVTEQELAIHYPEFQKLMLQPASAQVAKALHSFVDHILLQTTNGGVGSRGTSSASPSTSTSQGDATSLSKEIHGFIQQTMSQVQKISAWKGRERIAHEGIEKYICSKAYSKLFASTWSDKQKDATLKRKLSLLTAHIGPQNLDGLVGVEAAPEWTDALTSLRHMNEYRSPRDKMECVVKTCQYLQNCILHVHTAAHRLAAAAAAGPTHKGQGVASEQPESSGASSSTNSPTSRRPPSHNGSLSAMPSGVNLGGADDFLPTLILCVLRANPDNLCSNVTFIDLFRDKNLMEMSGEYNLTALQSAAEFWLTCQAAHLRMSEEEYDVALENVFAKPLSRRTASFQQQPPHDHSSASPQGADGIVASSVASTIAEPSSTLASSEQSSVKNSTSIMDELFVLQGAPSVPRKVTQDTVTQTDPERDDEASTSASLLFTPPCSLGTSPNNRAQNRDSMSLIVSKIASLLRTSPLQQDNWLTSPAPPRSDVVDNRCAVLPWWGELQLKDVEAMSKELLRLRRVETESHDLLRQVYALVYDEPSSAVSGSGNSV